MNNVTKNKSKKIRTPQTGDIYENPENGDLYIIAEVGIKSFCAVSLKDGHRWVNPEKTIQECIAMKDESLVFYGSNMAITVG